MFACVRVCACECTCAPDDLCTYALQMKLPTWTGGRHNNFLNGSQIEPMIHLVYGNLSFNFALRVQQLH